jgi:uncharacterized membrane protein YbhN (UPF0104 family)
MILGKRWIWNWRSVLGLAVLLLTIFLIVHFFVNQPHYFTQLRQTKLSTILAVIALNALLLVTLVVIYDLTLQLCSQRLPWKEQTLLTAYSAVINFFGPLQSGPAVRAVYLKSKHNLRLRDYFLASLIYYAIFALINAVWLFGFSRPWWQALIVVLVVAIACVVIIRYFLSRKSTNSSQQTQFRVEPRVVTGLFVATVVQVLLLTICYFIELRAVSPAVSFHQAIIYSGAANFALFVSLTPDAIGFRESFLVLSRQLHHISTAVIINANIIDRVGYVIFLLALFVIILLTHARDQLNISPIDESSSPIVEQS